MSELRQDPATKQWVILATERAKRPHDFSRPPVQDSIPEYKADCPFCPGNESMTPPETMAYRKGGASNGPGWWVVVFSAALSTGAFFVLWALVENLTGVSERVTIERADGAGLRRPGCRRGGRAGRDPAVPAGRAGR